VSSRSGAINERWARPVDQVDDHWLRRDASADRRDRLLPAYACASRDALPAWLGSSADPLSVDGMIVAASTTLLADSRSGGRGGLLPWALLAVGSVASVAANVAVAEPTATGRVIAAWQSYALIGSYELLMRQVGRTAAWPPRSEASASVRHRMGAVFTDSRSAARG
jgi:Protein of unknown function (DUF2637)